MVFTIFGPHVKSFVCAFFVLLLSVTLSTDFKAACLQNYANFHEKIEKMHLKIKDCEVTKENNDNQHE
jgi:hypothetical protein